MPPLHPPTNYLFQVLIPPLLDFQSESKCPLEIPPPPQVIDSAPTLTMFYCLDTDRARDTRTDEIVALKKVRMENEKDGQYFRM